jgi:quercetin dioxygenase-like cupin family protein
MRERAKRERPPGVPPAQRLLLENPRTRVWEMTLEPGEEYPMHSHEHPYLSLVIEGADLVLVEATGGEEPLSVAPGAVVWREPPERHAVRNVGPTRFRNRLVEFLR